MNKAIGRTFARVAGTENDPRFDGEPVAVTKDRYPGTSGNTHGEAKATTPAANARKGAHHAIRSK
jgi:hypothetical protein